MPEKSLLLQEQSGDISWIEIDMTGANVRRTLDETLREHGSIYSYYNRILLDPFVRAMLDTRKAALRRIPSGPVIDKEAPNAEALGELCARVMREWREFWESVGAMQDALMIGFKVGELIWKEVDGLLLVDMLAVRDSDQFKFTTDGTLLYRKDRFLPANQRLDEQYKFLVYTHDMMNRNRYGMGYGPSLDLMITAKRRAWADWISISAKQAAGIPTFITDGRLDTTELESIKTAMRRMRNGDPFVTSTNGAKADFSIVTPDISKGDAILRGILDEANREITTLLMGETVTSGQGVGNNSSGSYALGQVSAGLSESRFRSDAECVSSFITQALRWAVELNLGVQYSQFVKYAWDFETERMTSKDRVDLIWKLALAVDLDVSKRQLREWAGGLNEPEDEDDSIQLGRIGIAQQLADAGIQGAGESALSARRLHVHAAGSEPETYTQAVARMIAESESETARAHFAQIESAFSGASSADELKRKIKAWEPDGKSKASKAMTAVMAGMLFYGMTIGAVAPAMAAKAKADGKRIHAATADGPRYSALVRVGLAPRGKPNPQNMQAFLEPTGLLNIVKKANTGVDIDQLTEYAQTADNWAFTSTYLSNEAARDKALALLEDEVKYGEFDLKRFQQRWADESLPALADHQTKLIFEQSLKTADSAMQYVEAQTNPFIDEWLAGYMYRGILDEATRDEHRELIGKYFKKDNPALDSIWPPNGFNCRCWLDEVYNDETQGLRNYTRAVPDLPQGFDGNVGKLLMRAKDDKPMGSTLVKLAGGK